MDLDLGEFSIVKFLNKNGYDHEALSAESSGLVEGGCYIVESMEVGRSSSTVKLHGYRRHFNTVMFETVLRHTTRNWFEESYPHLEE